MKLHPQLQHDTIILGTLPLSLVLLMPDAHYPWLILVPQREHIGDIDELSEADQQQLMQESSFVSRTMKTLFQPDKINIAALGNIVPQLHIHHVARFHSDAAWPAPVWGALPAQPYEAKALEQRIRQLQQALFPTSKIE